MTRRWSGYFEYFLYSTEYESHAVEWFRHQEYIVWIEEGIEPSQSILHPSSPAVRNFWVNRSLLEVKDVVLFFRRRMLLMVPHPLKEKSLHHCHDTIKAGHQGRMRTLAHLRRKFYWHQMCKDCDIYFKSCKQCSRQKKANINSRGGLDTVEWLIFLCDNFS